MQILQNCAPVAQKDSEPKGKAALNEELETGLQTTHWHGNLYRRQQEDTKVRNWNCLFKMALYLHYVT